MATLGVGVDRAARHRLAVHLLQAERLSTELEVGVVTTPPADLVLDGVGAVGARLDDIGLTAQAEPFRPERDATKDLNATFGGRVGSIDPFVGELPTFDIGVFV